MELLDLLPTNPYEGFPADIYPYTPFTQWGSEDPNFEKLIRAVRPSLIVEVGTWYGGSSIHMAHHCWSNKLDTKLICVDSFNGAPEMWKDKSDKTRYGALMFRHGRPDFYMQFLANVVHQGFQDRIIPFSMDSLGAAEVLADKGVQADMCFIDGNHAYNRVTDDMWAYWPLVAPGGVMFGDDYGVWSGVTEAVKDFGLPFEIHGRQWEIWKPL